MGFHRRGRDFFILQARSIFIHIKPRPANLAFVRLVFVTFPARLIVGAKHALVFQKISPLLAHHTFGVVHKLRAKWIDAQFKGLHAHAFLLRFAENVVLVALRTQGLGAVESAVGYGLVLENAVPIGICIVTPLAFRAGVVGVILNLEAIRLVDWKAIYDSFHIHFGDVSLRT